MTEQCNHTSIRLVVQVSRCDDCGQIFHHRIEDPMLIFRELIQQVHQGKLPAELAISNEELTEQQKQQLMDIVPCTHKEIEGYECGCSRKMRWRCKSCGLSADTQDTFRRLGKNG